MPQDATQIVVAANGKVWVAPVGTTQPTTPTATPVAAWKDIGFVTEDGVKFTDSKDITDIQAWQSFYPVRKIITGKSAQLAYGLRQWDENTIPLAFGGGAVTNLGGGVWRYAPPAAGTLDQRAMMIDWLDGIRNYRLIIPQGLVSDAVETNLVRTDSAVLPIVFAVVPTSGSADPYILLTDDIAFSS